MSHKTLLFALGALALAACADSTAPTKVDPEMLVRPPLPTARPQQIAFTRGEDASSDIYVMYPDGTGEVRLTSNTSYDGEPALSPDGSKIAFTRLVTGNYRVAGNYEILVMTPNTSGTGLVNVTKDASGDDDEAAWSPDGSKIAFTSNRDGSDMIYVVYADGSGPVPGFTSALGRSPAWSPDGSKIAFTKLGSTIYVMDATDGRVINSLSTYASRAEDPAWSPDGSKIAFTSDQYDVNGDIFVMNANSSGIPVRLTTYAGYDGQPAWSPDGSQIAFTSDRHGNAEIYLMNATNGESSGIPLRRTTNTVFDGEASWTWAPLSSK